MTTVVLTATSGTRDFTKFDAYLDTQGVVFTTGEGMQGQTQTKEQRPVRQDTGTNPWETRPESGDIFSQGDFIDGMGQTYFHRQNRDEAKYLWSRGIDIAKGSLQLYRSFVEADASNGLTATAIANSTLFGSHFGDIRKTTDLSSWAADNPTAGWTNHSLTSAGTELYAGGTTAAGGLIYKRASDATWSTFYGSSVGVTPSKVHWTKDRLMWFDSGNRKFYEQVTSGTANAVEVDTYPTGWECKSIFTAGAYIYVVMSNTTEQRTIAYHYGLNSGGTAIEPKGQTDFPTGLVFFSGIGYVGLIFLGGGETEAAGGYKPVFYQAVQNDSGFLTYFKVAEGGNATTTTATRVGAMFAAGTEVLLDWPTHATGDLLSGSGWGLASYDVARGAFSLLPRVSSTAPTSNPDSSVIRFKGRVVYGNSVLSKTYAESATVKESSGTLISSIADWNNAGPKIWDQVEWLTDALPAGATVQGSYTTKHPEKNDWTTFGTQSTLNSESLTSTLSSVSARIFALKFVLNRATDTTTGPVLHSFSARSFPKPATTEWRLTRYVRIMDLDGKDGGGEEIRQNPETVREWLLNKANEPVTWYEAGATYSVRVVDIGDIEPGFSGYSQTAGDPSRDVFFMRLVLEGSKTA